MADRRGPKLKGPVTAKEMKVFEGMCYIQCTLDEMSNAFGIDNVTLIARVEEYYKRKFSSVFKQKKEGGKMSLRRAQWKNAIDKNNTVMQIWLGKNNLDQSDNRAQDKAIAEALVYSARVGPSGDIVNEIKDKTQWIKDHAFDVSTTLKEIQAKESKKKKPKKKTAKKKKAK